MHYDEQGIKRIVSILNQLSDQIFMFTQKGQPVKGPLGGKIEFPDNVPEGEVFSYMGNIFFRSSDLPELVFVCSQMVEGGVNILILAANLAKSLLNNSQSIQNVYDVYRRVLQEELYGQDVAIAAQEYHIPLEMERGVLVFYTTRVEKQSSLSLLKEIIPQNDNDVLIEMDKYTTVLLLDVSELKTDEELTQFAQALQETIMTETGILVIIGIGERIKKLNESGKSYRQGKKAIKIGQVFQKEKSIFTYSKMILERLLVDIPREIGQKYPSMIFNRRTARLFNDEMLQTIEMFFNKDLNLSDTARQLYIHRNTLVYRLDKVQRMMGLDLRSFQDAVTFKLLLEMRKGANAIFEKEKV